MKKLILMLSLVILSISLFSQTVYIDPTYSGTESGTITQPYTTFPSIVSNTTYLIKGGTTLNLTNNVGGTVDAVKISTYGTGKATLKYSSDVSGRLLNLRGNSNIIENLTVRTQNHYGSVSGTVNAEACTPVELWVNGGTGTLTNVSVIGGWRGIVASHYAEQTGKLFMTGCSVDSVQHDGIYITYFDSVTVKSTKVTNSNLNWANDYGGDAIQIGNVNNVTVTYCYLDHSTTKGKYSLIITDSWSTKVDNCYLKSLNGESCFYPSNNDTSSKRPQLSLTNTILEGGWRTMQNRTTWAYINNCLFIGGDSSYMAAIDSHENTTLLNSTFVNYPISSMSSYGGVGNLVVTANNNIFYNCATILQNSGNLVGNHNDFYPTETNFLTNNFNLDPQFSDTKYYEPTNATLLSNAVGFRHTIGDTIVRAMANGLASSNVVVPVDTTTTDTTTTTTPVVTPTTNSDSIILVNATLTALKQVLRDSIAAQKILINNLTISNTSAKIDSLNLVISTLKSINTTLNDTNVTLAATSATLNTNVAALNARINALIVSNNALKNTNATLNGNISTLNAKIISLNAKISTLNTTITTLNAKIVILQNTITALKKK